MKINKKAIGFLWDRGNLDKNWVKHKVKNTECEEVFSDKKKVQFKDVLHSDKENRFILLGKTKKDRLLFIAFTLRDNEVRVISARDINKRERKLYEKKT